MMQLCRAALGMNWIARLLQNSSIPLIRKTWTCDESIIAGFTWQAPALSFQAAGLRLGQ